MSAYRNTRAALIGAHEEEGATSLCSPHVGRFQVAVAPGQLVEAGQVLGTLSVLKKTLEVVAPAGISGRVSGKKMSRERAVAYGDELLSLQDASATDAPASHATTTPSGLSLEAGQLTYDAPTDGLFYHCASPEDPPFITEGASISPGDTVGLIEVMKFFYPVAYEGSEAASVTRILVADATPVVAGQPLILLTRA